MLLNLKDRISPPENANRSVVIIMPPTLNSDPLLSLMTKDAGYRGIFHCDICHHQHDLSTSGHETPKTC